MEEWNAREADAVWYGLPVEGRYDLPDGRTYARCHVEAFNRKGNILGYVPLPHRYAAAWVQLCYSVVYWMSMWKAWVAELGGAPRVPQQPEGLVQACINNSATRFLKYCLIRRLVVGELLQHSMSPMEDDELDIFDEYLIRDRFDWLWTEMHKIPAGQLRNFRLDPVHAANRATFCKAFVSPSPNNTRGLKEHYVAWRNRNLLVPEQMIVPKMAPTQTWMWGQINHFNFQAYFAAQFPDLVAFYLSEQHKRSHLDAPYDPDAQGLPARWHEGHEPALRFLTIDEDKLFNPTA